MQQTEQAYSITSSARASSIRNTSMPSCLHCVKVNDQLELGWLQNWEVGWIGAPENTAGIDAHLAKRVRKIGPVAHQQAGFDHLAGSITRGQPVAHC